MRMVLDNPLETITKDFNNKRIRTIIQLKDGSEPKEVCERLTKYSQTVEGYRHQLELKGFKEVSE